MPTTRSGLKTLRGRLVSEWPVIQKARVGKRRGVHLGKREIKGIVKLTVHRRSPYRGALSLEPKDPREARAIPHDQLRGTLPERILYKSFLLRHLIPDVDFSFQSSLDGGRLQLGGLVVDFELLRTMTAIRVQGTYWHGQFDVITGDLINGNIGQARSDDVQRGILEGYGWTVLDIYEDLIYDPVLLEYWLQRWVDPQLIGVR